MRKALLCGINAYPTAPLKGCINDVENLHNLLTETFGFAPQNIRVIKDEQVVKSNLLKEWRWLTEGANAGDTLVFHFSGHGSNVPDVNGDEADLRDEITCLYDIDFSNSDSYLSDDEWYELVQDVNTDANLIIIKDTCHSGGSTRLLGVQDDQGFEKIILAETSQIEGNYSFDQDNSEKSIPNSRFLVPPGLPSHSWRSGDMLKPSLLSQAGQVNLMACKESQTAADAYIGNNFNGAFTYYLCKALRNNQELDSLSLIKTVVEQLKGHYEQIPQHEGENIPAPIFGGWNEKEDNENAVIPVTPQLSLLGSEEEQKTQQMLIQAYMKLLDTLTVMQSPARSLSQRQGIGRMLVTVHGIGSHSAGYSNQWWQSLQPHVGNTFNSSGLGEGRHEVVWSDLVNKTRSLYRNLDSVQVNQLRQSILDVIKDRQDQVLSDKNRSVIQMPTMRGDSISIDDFLIYMLNDNMRRKIIKRFTEVINPLLLAGITLDIISHSWGTVVAYEGLRELEGQNGLPGRVANWFTVGSALSLAPVQGRLRPENRPKGNRLAPYPALVDKWINLDAEGDMVGGRLARKFPVNREYLKLSPTTCPRRFWGFDLGCAHSSYFKPENLKVNKDIFAKHILESS